jgi:hypothetical protein
MSQSLVDEIIADFNTVDSQFATEAISILELSIKTHGWNSICPWQELRRVFLQYYQPHPPAK